MSNMIDKKGTMVTFVPRDISFQMGPHTAPDKTLFNVFLFFFLSVKRALSAVLSTEQADLS